MSIATTLCGTGVSILDGSCPVTPPSDTGVLPTSSTGWLVLLVALVALVAPEVVRLLNPVVRRCLRPRKEMRTDEGHR